MALDSSCLISDKILMEEDVNVRLEALILKVCHLTNEMDILKIENELLLNEVKNLQLKFHLGIVPKPTLVSLDV